MAELFAQADKFVEVEGFREITGRVYLCVLHFFAKEVLRRGTEDNDGDLTQPVAGSNCSQDICSGAFGQIEIQNHQIREVGDIGFQHIDRLLAISGYRNGGGPIISLRKGQTDETQVAGIILRDQHADWLEWW